MAEVTKKSNSVIVDEETGETGKPYFINERVKVKIEYPKDYKKTKHYKDGDVVELHPLTADAFIEKGVGKKVADK